VTPQALLAEAARRGIALYPDGHNIRYRGPKTDLADLKPKLAAHKGELLTLLRAERDEVKIDLAGSDGRNPLPNPGHPAYSIPRDLRALRCGNPPRFGNRRSSNR